MKKVGRRVHLMAPASSIKRIGEGSFIRLNDGRILFAFTEFLGGREDEDIARISCISSTDEGETWSTPEPKVFFSSPASPMSVKNFKDLTVAIFNPIPEHILRDDDAEFWGRTPYTMAVRKKTKPNSHKKSFFILRMTLTTATATLPPLRARIIYLLPITTLTTQIVALTAPKLLRLCMRN